MNMTNLTIASLTKEVAELAMDLRGCQRLFANKVSELRAETERAERYKGYLDELRDHLGMDNRHYGNIIDHVRELDKGKEA